MNYKSVFWGLLITNAVVIGSCAKNESATPDISIQEMVSSVEGNDQQVKALIPVTLSVASDEQVSILWSTSEGSAKAGEDFISMTDALLIFQPGETVKNIEVNILNDVLYETDEDFFVTTGNAKNGNLVKSKARVTIKNDDALIPELNVSSGMKIKEGSSTPVVVKIAVTLSVASDKEVSLKWSTLEGTARAGNDYNAVSGAGLVFAPGEILKYIDIQLISDQVLEFNEFFSMKIDEVNGAVTANLETRIDVADDDTYIPEIAADGPLTPDTYPGMQLVWSDEFNTPEINMENWTFELGGGGWGNNELQLYTNSPSNAYINDGKLNITATKNSGVYNSARMITKGKKEFTYGRIDIRAKMPVGQGIWPALWTLGANISQYGWPSCGEIDIMEYLGHDVKKTYGTVHYNENGHQYKGSSYTVPDGKGYNEQFHVFSIVWQEGSIVWYVDYQKYFEASPATIKFDAFNLAQFFIFNVAVGGNWPGNPDETTVFPQTMQVDYVRVFMPSN